MKSKLIKIKLDAFGLIQIKNKLLGVGSFSLGQLPGIWVEF